MIQRLVALLLVLSAILIAFPSPLRAQADYKRYFDEDNLPKVREIFSQGRYDIVIQVCEYADRRGQPSWEWRVLHFEALAAIGRYEEAYDEAKKTAERFREDLGALLRLHRFFKIHGYKEDAAARLADLNLAAKAVPKKERTTLDLVHLGEAALILGADPSKVIEQYFGPAKRVQPKGKEVPPGLLEAHLASARLAEAKEDLKKAAENYGDALKLAPTNPEALFGMAKALFPSDREAGTTYLEKTRAEAPLHFGALLLQAESAINFEQYEAATELLNLVESVNPRHPEAHSYRAILAELERNDHTAFEQARGIALSVWRDNPEIDYLIGRVLSRKYRYEEGAQAQKRALAFDPGFLPAKLQLALDYLRLGRVDAAWPLAKEVAAADPYNVLAFNLEVLEKEIASFTSVKTPDFIIRLPPEEAEIYGERVVEILTEAKKVLGEKYGLIIDHPTLVEFYPDQQDFAIRSFGSLGGDGLLGVCFGSVVTMNSPGSITAAKSNWEATLWHEYCHVITLTATKNKMPRWLSEGISVYEEKQRQANWGQEMNPDYRKMILEENALTPVGDMSQAFFQAKDSMAVMFAYYQSMLVVEHLVETYGLEKLRAILADLGEGALVNDAIARHTVPMEEFETSFALFATKLAEAYGPGVDWTKPKPEEMNPRALLSIASYLKDHPNHFEARRLLTEQLLEAKNWDAAIESADAFITLLPEYTGQGNGYTFKALALRSKEDAVGEATVLELLAAKSAEAFQAYQRLIEVNFEKGNWDGVITNAARGLAINPFTERIHYCSGCAHEAKAQPALAVRAFENALRLNPANPSEVRFRLARNLKGDDPAAAKRHLLDALADSPRYREAHGMLIEIVEGRPTTPVAMPPAASPVPAPAPAPSAPKEEPKEKQIPLPGDKPTPAPQ
ncbi:MAG: peptidase MA family metallohydrolase [Verrucomicrobiales bacterium]|nr:peptidase MA family metallohydrolase [Verrucomicrobiales bacterium]